MSDTMVEIKFRAWDEYTKDMQYMDDSAYFGLSAGDILNRFSNVMQYTGYSDERGIECYADDLISFRIDYGDVIVGRIKMAEGMWAVVDKTGEYIIDLWYCIHNCRTIIVGNIHENDGE